MSSSSDYTIRALTDIYKTYTYFINILLPKIETLEKITCKDPTNWKLVAQLEALGIEVPPFRNAEEEAAFRKKQKQLEELKKELDFMKNARYKIVQQIVRRERYLSHNPHP